MHDMKLAKPHSVYTLFKYSVYAILVVNVALFFQEEAAAARELFAGRFSAANMIELFTATIDTAAWVVLLLLFELETWLLPDDKLRAKNWQYSLAAVRVFSYTVIIYSAYGYLLTLLTTYNNSPIELFALCELVGHGYSVIATLNEYPALDGGNCATLVGQPLLVLDGTKLIGSADDWRHVQLLAWLDVVNSVAWLVVVAVLEVDVLLQLRGHLQGRVLLVSRWLKGMLYSILFVATIVWLVMGDLLGAWDAFIWLVAFVFIEMNLFQWRAESASVAQQ